MATCMGIYKMLRQAQHDIQHAEALFGHHLDNGYEDEL